MKPVYPDFDKMTKDEIFKWFQKVKDKKRYKMQFTVNGHSYVPEDKWLISKFYPDFELSYFNKEIFDLLNHRFEPQPKKLKNPKTKLQIVLDELLSIRSYIHVYSYILEQREGREHEELLPPKEEEGLVTKKRRLA